MPDRHRMILIIGLLSTLGLAAFMLATVVAAEMAA